MGLSNSGFSVKCFPERFALPIREHGCLRSQRRYLTDLLHDSALWLWWLNVVDAVTMTVLQPQRTSSPRPPSRFGQLFCACGRKTLL